MSRKHTYSFVILRYLHDTTTGEKVNVGLILLDQKSGQVFGKTQHRIGRFRCLFPNIERSSFVQTMKNIDRGIQNLKKSVKPNDLFVETYNIMDSVRRFLPVDDSALQWSEVSSGITDDLELTFDRLYKRYVIKYEVTSNARRSDEDVWRPVKSELSSRNIDVPFTEKTIQGDTDSIRFRHAWKNGSWHAYEPISFDLADADHIKDKARRWRGHLSATSDGLLKQDVKLHFILGAPKTQILSDAFNSAMEILANSDLQPTIYRENELSELVDLLEDKWTAHVRHEEIQR